jgi:hypothetical protein
LDITLDSATHDLLDSTGSITKEDTIFDDDEGGQDAIAARLKRIRSLLYDPPPSGFDKTKLQECLAKLSGGAAALKLAVAQKSKSVRRIDTMMHSRPWKKALSRVVVSRS